LGSGQISGGLIQNGMFGILDLVERISLHQ